MQTNRTRWIWRAATAALVIPLLVRPAATHADNGSGSTTMSFFSGGNGAHADWLATDDQPPGDTDGQAIRLLTVDGAPTFQQGYAGILFHHVTGIPATAFPDSSFWSKAPNNPGPTLGSPRLVVEFQDALGQYVGNGSLRQNVRGNDWEMVSDAEFGQNLTPGAYPNSAWDVTGGTCGFRYNVQWSDVQACFADDTVLAVFIVADAYGIYHLIDDITVNNKRFSSGSDNGGGSNDPAGPLPTIDASLLPPILPLPQPQ